ncbi:unnamed protein product [Protopolystoma xenopodis]|uniref:Uncharacterized protein n=1 Tax=Protopolystoma xenopodis TaxID=117903 RepID=A0A448X4N6_9PLAT|nr:unnamed protein product [Protopolystoma xenopodis]
MNITRWPHATHPSINRALDDFASITDNHCCLRLIASLEPLFKASFAFSTRRHQPQFTQTTDRPTDKNKDLTTNLKTD